MWKIIYELIFICDIRLEISSNINAKLIFLIELQDKLSYWYKEALESDGCCCYWEYF